MTGTPSIPGTAAVEKGARLLLEAGLDPMRVKSQRLTAYLIELADAWLVPLGGALATRETAAAAAATSRTATRRPNGSSSGSPRPTSSPTTAPDRFRFGLPPLTTRFTDVWTP